MPVVIEHEQLPVREARAGDAAAWNAGVTARRSELISLARVVEKRIDDGQCAVGQVQHAPEIRACDFFCIVGEERERERFARDVRAAMQQQVGQEIERLRRTTKLEGLCVHHKARTPEKMNPKAIRVAGGRLHETVYPSARRDRHGFGPGSARSRCRNGRLRDASSRMMAPTPRSKG